MFRIGEFSKIAQVSGRLLRYYDEIGLLTPEYIDPQSGYRYYTAEQLPRLNRILALKDLGFTLDQVANLLSDQVTPDEIRGMLAMKKAQIEQSVREEVARLQHVELRLAQIEREGQLWDREIVLKRVPTAPFLSVRVGNLTEQLFGDLLTDIRRSLPSGGQPPAFGHFAAIMHSAVFESQDMDIELGFLVADPDCAPLTLSSGNSLTVRELAGVDTMASIVAQGWDESLTAYNALGTWIETNAFQPAGPVREIFFTLQDPEQMANNVLEVQFPVTVQNN